MSLKEKITDDMKAAMRAKESARLGTIRLLTSAIKQKEVDERIELTDEQILAVIEKTGLLTELRAREFYEKPTSERKRKHAAAVKRHYKRIRSQQLPKKLF